MGEICATTGFQTGTGSVTLDSTLNLEKMGGPSPERPCTEESQSSTSQRNMTLSK